MLFLECQPSCSQNAVKIVLFILQIDDCQLFHEDEEVSPVLFATKKSTK